MFIVCSSYTRRSDLNKEWMPECPCKEISCYKDYAFVEGFAKGCHETATALAKWLDEDCTEHCDEEAPPYARSVCGDCWQQLCKEVGLEEGQK
ncbi:hypothetical protein LCGC14_1546390 [marine sediment metagenome]|uniref:Uncharacterized protein n=1 Tax=marine sediment metagenome TaxID=412755 RepID=A0A0F9L7P1_9ZZZZ